MGGYIGIGFSFAGTTNDVVDACSKGREGECGKIAVKDYSKFALTTGGGMLGGVWGSSAALAGCAAIGIVTAGAGGVACAVVGSVAGGYAGSTGAETILNKVLEHYDN